MINPKSLIEMLESSYDGIWITDGNGRILFANSANASLLGVTKEDLMGKMCIRDRCSNEFLFDGLRTPTLQTIASNAAGRTKDRRKFLIFGGPCLRL